MNLDLPAAASDFAESARRAIVEAGGVDLARRAEVDARLRTDEAGSLLEALGATELDVRAGEEHACVGAELCRLAGQLAFPFPVASLLATRGDQEGRFVTLIDTRELGRGHVWADHGDLPGPWVAIALDGRTWRAQPVSRTRNQALAPFAQYMQLGESAATMTAADACWLMDFVSWQVLGAVESAHTLAVQHVTSRQQFGRPLAEFQGVQFHVADAEVAIRGLRQLAHFTLWRLMTRPDAAVPDALALRAVALQTARSVLGISQLLHGATGFCDEHDLTTVLRSVQAPLRLPTDLERTNDLLVEAIDQVGFDSLFAECGPRLPSGGVEQDDPVRGTRLDRPVDSRVVAQRADGR